MTKYICDTAGECGKGDTCPGGRPHPWKDHCCTPMFCNTPSLGVRCKPITDPKPLEEQTELPHEILREYDHECYYCGHTGHDVNRLHASPGASINDQRYCCDNWDECYERQPYGKTVPTVEEQLDNIYCPGCGAHLHNFQISLGITHDTEKCKREHKTKRIMEENGEPVSGFSFSVVRGLTDAEYESRIRDILHAAMSGSCHLDCTTKGTCEECAVDRVTKLTRMK